MTKGRVHVGYGGMVDGRDEVLALVKEDGMNLRLASEELRNDKEVVMTAMKNCQYAFQFASESLQQDAEVSKGVVKDDTYYYNIVDPRNGLKYDIPLLSPLDPTYRERYIHFMKTKETSPDTFEKMLRWD